MERFEMAEALAKKAGVSLEAARDALRKTDWDALEAYLLLQKESKASQESKARGETDAGWLARAVRWVGDLVARGGRCFVSVSRDGKPRFELTVTTAVLLGLLLHGFFVFGVLVMLCMGYRFAFISETRDRAMRHDVDEAARAAREVKDRADVNSMGQTV